MSYDFGSLIGFAVTAFTGFFAIMNPLANLPAYMALTNEATPEEKRRVKKRAVLTAFYIVTAFVVLGQIIFSLFGLTIPAFKITGGILIFIAGINMVYEKKEPKRANEPPEEFDEVIAITPLAIPLMAGPGSIVTAMTFVSGKDWLHMGIVILMFGAVCYLHYIAFSMSQFIVEKLGNTIMTTIGRIMGLIIAVIGTSMVIEGIRLSIDFGY